MFSDAAFVRRQNQIDREIKKLEHERLHIHNKLKILRKEKEELRIQHSLSRLKNRPDASEWLNKEYTWSKQVHEILKNTFKFDTFRPNQLAAINATLSKNHVLLVMPTGGGKSLVYQLPSLVTNNLTVVICPLISLIEDQVMALKRLGISADTVNSNTPSNEKKEIAIKMMTNRLNLIFVTPEWIAKTKGFMNDLTKLHKAGLLDRFVIDEVHCCSEWGHDFRTDYLSLSLLKGQFPGVPILGLTATATSDVVIDVQTILQIPEAVIMTAPYNRPNLFYKVLHKPEKQVDSLAYLENLLKEEYKNQSGIIYAGTQKDCEELSSELRKRGLKVSPYHANIRGSVKSSIHKKWAKNTYQAVIATIAFGMGIDKPDVRFVIHYAVPKTIEGLYQESGRAGRDGEKADCILMFNLADWLKHFSQARTKKEERSITDMLHYCIDVNTCRRKIFSKYFDDDWRSSDCKEMCDHCRDTSIPVQTYNILSCFKDIVNLTSIASAKDVSLTLKKLIDAWFKTGPKKLQLLDDSPSFSREQAEHILAFLLSKEFLVVKRGYTMVSTLAYIDTNMEQSFDSKKYSRIIMEYGGTLKGVEQVLSSATFKVKDTAVNETSVMDPKTVPSTSKLDSDTDGGYFSTCKRLKKCSSSSSENSDASSASSSNDDQEPKRKKQG